MCWATPRCMSCSMRTCRSSFVSRPSGRKMEKEEASSTPEGALPCSSAAARSRTSVRTACCAWPAAGCPSRATTSSRSFSCVGRKILETETVAVRAVSVAQGELTAWQIRVRRFGAVGDFAVGDLLQELSATGLQLFEWDVASGKLRPAGEHVLAGRREADLTRLLHACSSRG